MLDTLNALTAPAYERHIAEPVHPPEFWQDWLQAAGGVPLAAPADLLGGASRLVVVAPHPDDELLMCGGLMQAALAQGVVLSIVSVTDGEACFTDETDRASVAAIRRAEAQAGLLVLGAGKSTINRLNISDGEIAAQEARVQVALEDLVQPEDLVVSTWRLDGHPDHDATGRASAAACANIGARLLEAPVWMWHWASPGHPVVHWSRLRKCALPLKNGIRKDRALACHRSQLTPRDNHAPVVDDALQARAAWPFEIFFLP